MRKEQRESKKTSLGEGQTLSDEELFSEAWRQGQLGGMVREEIEEDHRPRKKRKVIDTKWGQDAQPEDQIEKFKWLQEGIDKSDGKREMRQATLQPWSWLKIEARKVLIEIADGIEKRGKEQEAEEKREQCIQEHLELEIQLEQARHGVVEVEKSVTVLKPREQDIRVMMTKQREANEKEQEKLIRVEIGRQKREDLLARLQPWNWLEKEALKVVIEQVRKVEEAGIAATTKRNIKKRELESKHLKTKKRKPWSWLTVEARKVIVEIVQEVERKGRLQLGEKKKRELLEKLRGKSRLGLVPPLEDLGMELKKYPDGESGQIRLLGGTPIDISSYFCNQLIIIHLVGVKGSSGRKRTWSSRRGAWASWAGTGSTARRWAVGRRKSTKDGLTMDMAELNISCMNLENDSTIMLGEEKMEMELGLEDTGPIMIIEKKMANMGLEEHAPEYKVWEKEANEWLSGYFKTKKYIIGRSTGKFEFGEEILAHQELECHLIKEKMKPHHILDYFDTTLVTLDCNLISPTVQDLEDCCSSKDDQMLVDDRSQEHQKMENRAVGKGRNYISGVLGTCSLPVCVRSGQGGKVKEQVAIINNKKGVMMFDAEKDLGEEETRKSRVRVIEPEIARRMSLFEDEQMDISENVLDEVMEQETLPPEGGEEKEVRNVVIARRARNGQMKEAGVKVRRIDDMFRGGSPLVLKRKRAKGE